MDVPLIKGGYVVNVGRLLSRRVAIAAYSCESLWRVHIAAVG